MITISYLGYETTNKSVNSFEEGSCETIYMKPTTEALTEVVIGNYITKGIRKINDGSFQIDYSDFGILPGLIEADVLQTLQALPGIQSTDETVSNLNIRGGTHDQNLILWDGIKMYQSGHFFGLISAINPFITEKATLIKNGTNPEFTDGVSGTIIMIGKKSSVQVSARNSINDLLKTPTYSQYFDRISQDSEVEEEQDSRSDIGFNFNDINLRFNYAPSKKDKIRVNFLSINNQLVFTENTRVEAEIQSRQSSIEQNSIAAGLWYQRTWNNRFKTIAQVYETDYKLESINANIERQQRFLQENKVSETGIKVKGYYEFSKHSTLLAGYEFVETGVSNLNDIDIPVIREKRERVIRTHGLFTQLYYKPTKLASLNAGLRYNYNEKFMTHILEPRISYNQKFMKYFNLEVLAEFKNQNITQVINFQNDFLGIEKRRWILADNEDIPIVKSKQVSIGVGYNKNGWLVNVDGYLKKVKGISSKSQGFQNQYQRDTLPAVGEYNVKGIDFLINKRFKNVGTWLSYSLVNNRYTFDDFAEKEFPNNVDIRHSIVAGSSYTIKKLKLAAGLNWHSGLPTTRPLIENPVNGETINYQEANSSRLDDYFRLDISTTYNFDISEGVSAQTGFSILNVTNTKNIINEYYQIDRSDLLREELEFSLGITPNVTFRVSF